jgi:hypothetical protein
MNIIVRKTDVHFVHPAEEISQCLDLLSSNISPLKSVINIHSASTLFGLLVTCTNNGIDGNRLPSFTNVYKGEKYKGDGWLLYLIHSSEDDGHETRHSVIIIDDDVYALQLKLILS